MTNGILNYYQMEYNIDNEQNIRIEIMNRLIVYILKIDINRLRMRV